MSASPTIPSLPPCRFAIVSVAPRLVEAAVSMGPVRRALSLGLLLLENINLRDFSIDQRGSVDDKPYGGGEGMVLKPEPLKGAVESVALSRQGRHVVVMAAGAKLVSNEDIQKWLLISRSKTVIFVSGRFSGIDQRFIEGYADEEVSLGRVVLSSGDLPCLALLDAVTRFIPGALGDESSAVLDTGSAEYGGMREYPNYTRPEVFEEQKVPAELLSGDPLVVAAWRKKNLRPRQDV